MSCSSTRSCRWVTRRSPGGVWIDWRGCGRRASPWCSCRTISTSSRPLPIVPSISRAGRVRAEGPWIRWLPGTATMSPGATEKPAEDAGIELRVIEEGRRWGSGEVEIVSVELATDAGATRLVPTGTPCRLRIRYRAQREIDDFVVGVAWHRADGTLVAGHNTDLDGLICRGGSTAKVRSAAATLRWIWRPGTIWSTWRCTPRTARPTTTGATPSESGSPRESNGPVCGPRRTDGSGMASSSNDV